MARISRQTKEIIKTVIVLLIVAALVVVFIVYPLNRVRVSMGRADMDSYNPDSLPANDAGAWIEAGLSPDTFHVESDGLTTIACLYIKADTDSGSESSGTVFLIHTDGADRDEMLPLARTFLDSGFSVVAFDQRATQRSSGKYRSDGQFEATDVEEIIRYLDLRGQTTHPLILVGFGIGADAALLAALEEKRIDLVVAVNPYLTTRRMQDMLKVRHDMYWFPFFRTMMWWWYGIRSSYAASYRGIDAIKAVSCPTLLLTRPEDSSDAEVLRLKELSSPEFLESATLPATDEELHDRILRYTTGV
ncbi:MAG: alpha/beta hydrolase, partial [candidate division Zixibacteria bacterium]|nr:alpha/beta hydrolase [candidate division Zixibacteria bacterium]